MKKFISMMMVFAILLSLLAGCGKTEAQPAATEAAPAGPPCSIFPRPTLTKVGRFFFSWTLPFL